MSDLFNHPAADTQSDFDEFYARYPRKVGRGQARKAYAKALKKARHDDIMWGLSQQLPALEATEKKFRPHPATWLNGERWEDEPEQPDDTNPNSGGSNGGTGGFGSGFTAAAARLAKNLS